MNFGEDIAYGAFKATAEGWKEPFPVRMVKGSIALGASVLIVAGFGLMVIAAPKERAHKRRRR